MFSPLFAADSILSLCILKIYGKGFKEEKMRIMESKGLDTGRNKGSKRKEVNHQDQRWRNYPG